MCISVNKMNMRITKLENMFCVSYLTLYFLDLWKQKTRVGRVRRDASIKLCYETFTTPITPGAFAHFATDYFECPCIQLFRPQFSSFFLESVWYFLYLFGPKMKSIIKLKHKNRLDAEEKLYDGKKTPRHILTPYPTYFNNYSFKILL